MPLQPGSRLGPYEILAPLGAGGMGEVYRARDTKLKREVAIKVLLPAFAQDSDRIARFEREAIALAALHHPHIAALFGMDESGGQHFLVMELVEGETLAEHLASGSRSQAPAGRSPEPAARSLLVSEALGIARQIADALEAAHEKGIIHRDLKPANVKITPDGQVKVLDFGLAAVAQDQHQPRHDLSQSPTLSIHATQAGLILGTASYMSPEQASGRTVDKRSDIWSFGVVLWEMLAARRLFDGETVAHTLADVLRAPIDFSVLPTETPPRVRELTRRCLERDVKKRLRDIGEARIALEQTTLADEPDADSTDGLGRLGRTLRLARLGWTLSAVLAILAGVTSWIAWRPARVADSPLLRLQLDLGPNAAIETGGPSVTTAISPDGTRVVFPIGGSSNARRALGTKLLKSATASVLGGTEEGRDPFFSPDGRWIGFFAGSKLKKISVAGGPPIELCDAPNGRGGSWGPDDTIVAALAARGSGLFRVAAAGGVPPQPLTTVTADEPVHRWPQILPGNKSVLYSAGLLTTFENGSIKLLSLETGATKTVVRGAYFGRYLATSTSQGVLLYVRAGVMFGVPFDPARGETHGSPVALLDDVSANPIQGRGQFDFSRDGTFVYASGHFAGGWTVGLLDSTGTMTPIISKPADYVALRYSPDGQRLATSLLGDIWVHDTKSERLSRVTYSAQSGRDAVWTPDGTHLAYQLRPTTGSEIWWTRADGTGDPQRLLQAAAGEIAVPMSFSPNGRRLVYFRGPSGNPDLFTLPLDLGDPDHPKAGAEEAYLRTPFAEAEPMFSPDGRWIAYQSNETSRTEIYVRPFPGPGRKWPISIGGGASPRWSPNGHELFYVGDEGRLMVVNYTVKGDSFEAEKPTVWSTVPVNRSTSGSAGQDLAPDGKHFAVIRSAEDQSGAQAPVVFLLNFVDEIRRRISETNAQ